MRLVLQYILMPYFFLLSLDLLFGTHLTSDEKWWLRMGAVDALLIITMHYIGSLTFSATQGAVDAFFTEMEMIDNEQQNPGTDTEDPTG